MCVCVYGYICVNVLPRRGGDLEMLEGGMFKAWNR